MITRPTPYEQRHALCQRGCATDAGRRLVIEWAALVTLRDAEKITDPWAHGVAVSACQAAIAWTCDAVTGAECQVASDAAFVAAVSAHAAYAAAYAAAAAAITDVPRNTVFFYTVTYAAYAAHTATVHDLHELAAALTKIGA